MVEEVDGNSREEDGEEADGGGRKEDDGRGEQLMVQKRQTVAGELVE